MTETHFQPGDRDPQGRMGRLITFLANMFDGHPPPAIAGPQGIAASNSTGVDIDADGNAKIVAADKIAAPPAYFVTDLNAAPPLGNTLLNWQGIQVVRVAVGGEFDVGNWQAPNDGKNKSYTINVNNGRMAVEGNNDFY